MKLNSEKELKAYIYLYREIEKLWHEIARKAGLSDSAFTILYTILELGEGCLQKDICALNSISKQTINSSIKKMEREGLLEIRQDGGKDKRLFLTPQGKVLAKQKVLFFAEMENEVFTEMTEEESQELIRLTENYLERFWAKVNQV